MEVGWNLAILIRINPSAFVPPLYKDFSIAGVKKEMQRAEIDQQPQKFFKDQGVFHDASISVLVAV